MSMSSAPSIFNEWLKLTNKAQRWQRSQFRSAKHRVTCCLTTSFSSAAAAWSKKKKLKSFGPSQNLSELAFAGIHVISPRIFPLLTEEGIFSIIPAYLRLAAQGEKIQAFRADEYYWRDLGKPENIQQAEQDIKANLFR